MKKITKAAAFLLSLLMLVSLLAGYSVQAMADDAPADGPVMAKIKAARKLIVGTEAQYAP